uniref:Uncharacterized protein n=1 Tax=Anguilla anguilla TaxID=7936 RepID=A0A0E9R0U4_ANGAN
MFVFAYSKTNIPSLWSTSRSARINVVKRGVDCSVLRPLLSAQIDFKNSYFKFGLFNVRSLNNKAPLLNDYTTDQKVDIIVFN